MNKIKNFIKNEKKETIKLAKDFRNQPLASLGHFISIAIVLTSFIGFVIAYIMFIAEGGYSKQFSEFSQRGLLNGIESSFTSGTTEMLTTNIVTTIILCLLLAQIIVLFISFLKTEGIVKKIISSVLFVISVIFGSIGGITLGVLSGTIALPINIEIAILNMINKTNSLETLTIGPEIGIFACIGGIAILGFIIMMIFSKHRWMVKNTVIALICSFVLFPLILWLIENIIPLIILVAVCVIAFFILRGVLRSATKSTPQESKEISEYDLREKAKLQEELKKLKRKAKEDREYEKSHLHDADDNFYYANEARAGRAFFSTVEGSTQLGNEELKKAREYSESAKRKEERIAEIEEQLKNMD